MMVGDSEMTNKPYRRLIYLVCSIIGGLTTRSVSATVYATQRIHSFGTTVLLNVELHDFCVEEAWATSNSYQVQTGHRHRKTEKRMLIGILSIRSVTSKRSCALDDSPSCKRVESKR